jgi:hypothetical protein
MGYTTKKRGNPFVYLLCLLVKGYLGPLLRFWESSLLKKFTERDKGTGDTDTLAGLFNHVPKICLSH